MKTAPKKATRIKAGRIQRANYKWIYLFLLPTIVIFAMFYLMPIAQVFVTSFTKWDFYPTGNQILVIFFHMVILYHRNKLRQILLSVLKFSSTVRT